jgi:cytochrome c oxidase subunit II
MTRETTMKQRRNAGPAVPFLGMALVLAACHPGHRQSSLHPASFEAGEITRLWWIMFGVLTASFILVLALTLWATFRRRQKSPNAGGEKVRFVVWGGIAFPSIVLLGLLFYSLSVSKILRPPTSGIVIQVTGHMWWWEVQYPELGIITANEIYLPAGEPVRIELRSGDVIHSFWVPNLHGKMDTKPGLVNEFWLHANEPGRWRGQCAEFCGRQHALMAFEVVALSTEEFDLWVRARQPQSVVPATELGESLARGKEAFFRASCHECHAIRGTRAGGLIGPDLTHIGSRLTLGAGTLPNNIGNLMGWIVNPQEIKPGNLMPRTYLEPDELRAMVEYLQSLE